MAISGVGAALKRWNGASYDALAEINSIEGPGFSRDTIDTTALDTPGGYRTFIAGFRNPGTLSLTMNYTRAVFNTFKTDFESDTIQDYMLVLPDTDTTSIAFDGLVTEMPLSIPTDDKVTMSVTIQISGQVSHQSGEYGSPPS
jgi:predicted secreted protein